MKLGSTKGSFILQVDLCFRWTLKDERLGVAVFAGYRFPHAFIPMP